MFQTAARSVMRQIRDRIIAKVRPGRFIAATMPVRGGGADRGQESEPTHYRDDTLAK